MGFDSKWFEAALKAVGKKQIDLARYLKIQASAISRMKANKRQWKPHEIPLVAWFLRCSIEELLLHSGERSSDAVKQLIRPVDERSDPSPLTEGNTSEPTDHELLGDVLAMLEHLHQTEGIPISMRQLGEMAAVEYDEIVSLTDDPVQRRAEVARIKKRLSGLIKRNRGIALERVEVSSGD